MNAQTRRLFAALCARIAKTYGVDTVAQQFSIEPSIAQTLRDKIVEMSAFLPKINLLPVTEIKGQNILGGVSSPVSSRTDTSQPNKERQARYVMSLGAYEYECKQTNRDVALPYRIVDAWAKFKDFAERYSRYVRQRIANDMELAGWHGVSAAADTNLTANPLLQDLNKGWMQYMREALPANILTEGAETGEIRIGAGGDFSCLDVAVYDLLQGIPEYMRANLVALIGTDLIARDKAALLGAVANQPSEKLLLENALATYGGLPWLTPSNFPARGLVVTSLDNLSIYVQEDSTRRQIIDNPKKDQVEDFNCSNDAYVVEEPEKFVALEFANVKIIPTDDGDGGVIWT